MSRFFFSPLSAESDVDARREGEVTAQVAQQLVSAHPVPSQSAPTTGVLMRRMRYVVRAAYYIAVHRSLRHWKWSLAAEGTTWN